MFSVARMQTRHFRRFRQHGPFLAGDKNTACATPTIFRQATCSKHEPAFPASTGQHVAVGTATPLVSRYSCRATLVSHFSPYVFAVSHENRATPLKVSQKRPCRTLLGGCRTLSWPCIYHKIVSRYRGCRSYSVASRATLRH